MTAATTVRLQIDAHHDGIWDLDGAPLKAGQEIEIDTSDPGEIAWAQKLLRFGHAAVIAGELPDPSGASDAAPADEQPEDAARESSTPEPEIPDEYRSLNLAEIGKRLQRHELAASRHASDLEVGQRAVRAAATARDELERRADAGEKVGAKQLADASDRLADAEAELARAKRTDARATQERDGLLAALAARECEDVAARLDREIPKAADALLESARAAIRLAARLEDALAVVRTARTSLDDLVAEERRAVGDKHRVVPSVPSFDLGFEWHHLEQGGSLARLGFSISRASGRIAIREARR